MAACLAATYVSRSTRYVTRAGKCRIAHRDVEPFNRNSTSASNQKPSICRVLRIGTQSALQSALSWKTFGLCHRPLLPKSLDRQPWNFAWHKSLHVGGAARCGDDPSDVSAKTVNPLPHGAGLENQNPPPIVNEGQTAAHVPDPDERGEPRTPENQGITRGQIEEPRTPVIQRVRREEGEDDTVESQTNPTDGNVAVNPESVLPERSTHRFPGVRRILIFQPGQGGDPRPARQAGEVATPAQEVGPSKYPPEEVAPPPAPQEVPPREVAPPPWSPTWPAPEEVPPEEVAYPPAPQEVPPKEVAPPPAAQEETWGPGPFDMAMSQWKQASATLLLAMAKAIGPRKGDHAIIDELLAFVPGSDDQIPVGLPSKTHAERTAFFKYVLEPAGFSKASLERIVEWYEKAVSPSGRA